MEDMYTSIILYYVWWIFYLELLLISSLSLVKGCLKISNGLVSLCCIVFAICGIFAITTSDWISYNNIIKEQIQYQGTAATNLESFWLKVIMILRDNISFRCFIYVCSYFIFFLYLHFFVPAKYRFTFILLYVFWGLYGMSGGRQILSTFLFYIAFELFSKGLFLRICSVISIGVCFCLHKGTVLFLFPMFLMYIPITKKNILISVLCVASLSILFRFYLYDLITEFYPDYTYAYYLQEQADEINISRRIYYSSQVTLFLRTCYIPYLLYLSFKYRSLFVGKYRSFLYWGYLFYLCLYFANYSLSTPQRYIGNMLLIPILILTSYLFHKKENLLFRKVTWILLLVEALAVNISISGIR